jgi:integrase
VVGFESGPQQAFAAPLVRLRTTRIEQRQIGCRMPGGERSALSRANRGRWSRDIARQAGDLTLVAAAAVAVGGVEKIDADLARPPDRRELTVLPQANAYAMIRRRAAAAGIETKLGNHSFRATGITAYLKNGGTLEKAAAMANHASTRTTQLYDRRPDELSLDEVERIVI